MYKRQFYQIVESNRIESNRIEKSIRQRESNRIELFFSPNRNALVAALQIIPARKKWDLHLRRPCVEVLDKHSLRRLRLS